MAKGNSPTNIKILIADEQTLFREGVLALFGAAAGFSVIAEADDGIEAVDLAATRAPDVALLSMHLPKLDALAATRRITRLVRHPEIVIVASSHNESQMREAFEAGARAYLLRNCDFTELQFAVTKAALGEFYLSGPGGQDVISEYVRPLIDAQRPGGIMTQREKELAKLLADGYSTKEAAEILSISPKTAETHRASIMKKLGAKNVTDIVKYCVRNYLIEP